MIELLYVRDHPLFSAFSQEYREYTRGGGKSSCMLSKMLVLATVPVHENKFSQSTFYSMLLGRMEDVKSTLCICTCEKC